MKQRVAARLLLASCTLALGLGLGTAVAVTGILALQHPDLTVRSPGQVEGRLESGRHELFVDRAAPGGRAQLVESRPECSMTSLRTGAQAARVHGSSDFAVYLVTTSGPHRVACTSAIPVTVLVSHEGEGAMAYLAAAGRGLLLAVVLTALAALLAARALVTAGRLRSSSDPDDGHS